MPEIAIFSSSVDAPTYGPVMERLVAQGYEPWLYKADDIMAGTDSLQVHIDEQGELVLVHNDHSYTLSHIRSAWFRHPQIIGQQAKSTPHQLAIEHEVKAIQESIWQQIPETSWLNPPAKMMSAQAKLSQLVLAREIGFTIPETLVTNNWNAVDELLDNGDIIIKMPRGILHGEAQPKVLYTTVLNKDMWNQLTESNPFPGIYQQRISKEREWRVTIVGEDVFNAAIYTTMDAKDDWRRHQFTSKVSFRNETLPDSEGQRCIEFLGRLGLKYGTFDLIEDAEGKITFLECNPNGQYQWLEDVLDLPISQSIAHLLVDIYKANS